MTRKYRISAILSIPSFNNPIGSCQPQLHRKALVDLANKADIPIIEDDLYGDLAFNEERPWVIKHHDTEDRVLLCGSFSKSMGPGLRIGWISPGRYYDKVIAAKLGSTYASPTLMQVAVAEFLKNGGYDRHLRAMRKACKERLQTYRKIITEFFPSDSQVSDPKGGFLLWLELAERHDAWEIYRKSLRMGISVAPGPLFTANGNGMSHHIRLNSGLPVTERSVTALKTVARLLN
jgi:DNA-binding transcriptional MocR family regulator